MAFTRINPGGWAANAQLTSAQINAIDVDHANSLDKSVAGDNIAGTVGFSGTGNINAALAGTVKGTLANAIQSNVVAGIQSNVVGGINLNGGATDNVTFAARTKNVKIPPNPLSLQAGWTVQSNNGFLIGPANGQSQTFTIPHLINGATLSTVKAWLIVNNIHANVPANLPTLTVFRRTLFSAATADSFVTLTAGVTAFPTPGSGALWSASANLQNWTYTTTQNSVIDTSLYIYYLQIVDENGVNSIAGNLYAGFELGFTNVLSYQVGVG